MLIYINRVVGSIPIMNKQGALMFDTVDEIYNYIGQEMYDVLPEKWDIAWIDICLNIGSSIQAVQCYNVDQEECYFSLHKRNGAYRDSDYDKAFYALHDLMKKNETDNPWNKLHFTLKPDGDFDIEFKFDKDFAWYNSLDADSQEFDNLDLDIIKQIQTWDGVPESTPKYWLDN